MLANVSPEMIGVMNADGTVSEPLQCAVTGQWVQGRHMTRHVLDATHFYFVLVKAQHLHTQERHNELLALIAPPPPKKKTVKEGE